MADFLIGRQPIFDRSLNTFAFELLFRGKDFDLSDKAQASMATHQVITDTVLELGINTLADSNKIFINFTAQNILEKIPTYLPKDRVVIEVLEDVTVDLRIINSLKEMHEKGYTIALDDFIPAPQWRPLLEFCNIVKLDILAIPENDWAKVIKVIRHYPCKLLAEKVETHEQFEHLKELGCDYFQGYFLSKPNLVKGHRIGVNQAAAIRLLSSINKPELNVEEVATIISQDAILSFKLLHYINSAFFSIPRKIDSIRQAVVFLGVKEVRRWSNMLTLASLSDKPEAVTQATLVRAKMCELLAIPLGLNSDNLFFMGMLSNLDVILDLPLPDALAMLPLPNDIIEPVLTGNTLAGQLLTYVNHYEQWPPAAETFAQLDTKTIQQAYLDTLAWVRDALGAME
ncbi:MAG: HDOD domain-containing protein [Methylococcales bacterium]|nr:HDOD domain-containing protein [Methylococcales bacterium]